MVPRYAWRLSSLSRPFDPWLILTTAMPDGRIVVGGVRSSQNNRMVGEACLYPYGSGLGWFSQTLISSRSAGVRLALASRSGRRCQVRKRD